MDAADRLRVRVDGKHRAGEPSANQVVDELVADRPRVAARADHGDRTRVEDSPDRRHHRRPLPFLDVFVELFGRRKWEAHRDHAAFEVAGDIEPCVAKDIHHRPVVGKGLRIETFDAVASRDRGEVFEHHRREPASLLIVCDDERDLSSDRFGQIAVIPHDRHDLRVELGDQREPVAIVDLGEMMQLRFGQRRYR